MKGQPTQGQPPNNRPPNGRSLLRMLPRPLSRSLGWHQALLFGPVILLIMTMGTMTYTLVGLRQTFTERNAAVRERDGYIALNVPLNALERAEQQLLIFLLESQLAQSLDTVTLNQLAANIGEQLTRLATPEIHQAMSPEMRAGLTEVQSCWEALQPLLAELRVNVATTPEMAYFPLTAQLSDFSESTQRLTEGNTAQLAASEHGVNALDEALVREGARGLVLLLLFIMVVLVNMTYFIQQNYSTRSARDKAEAASSMKTQFLAGVSHELRTPLNAIINFTDFVMQEIYGPINASQRDALDKAYQSALHLLALINDILDLSKLDAGMMELFIEELQVAEVVNNAMNTARSLLRDKADSVQLIADLPPDLPPLCADKLRLRQILLNLLSNSIKFTPSGTITLQVSRVEGEDSLMFLVRDTGTGIPAAELPHLFEEFRQVSRVSPVNRTPQGTGLGLAITRRFTELHGGRIWIESEPGQGTSVYIQLPLKASHHAHP